MRSTLVTPDKKTLDGPYYISIIWNLELQVRAVRAVLMGYNEALALGHTLEGHDVFRGLYRF